MSWPALRMCEQCNFLVPSLKILARAFRVTQGDEGNAKGFYCGFPRRGFGPVDVAGADRPPPGIDMPGGPGYAVVDIIWRAGHLVVRAVQSRKGYLNAAYHR